MAKNHIVTVVCLVLLFYFVDSRIYNFYQNAYVIRFSRVDNEFWNNTIFTTYDTVASKITRDRFGINLTAITRVPITAADKPRMLIKAFKAAANSYQMKLVDMNEDFCDVIKSQHYGILPGFYDNGPNPGCPLQPGDYGIYNYEVIYNKFPPGLPAGDYKLQYILFLQKDNIRAHQFSAYGSIIYKNKLKTDVV